MGKKRFSQDFPNFVQIFDKNKEKIINIFTIYVDENGIFCVKTELGRPVNLTSLTSVVRIYLFPPAKGIPYKGYPFCCAKR